MVVNMYTTIYQTLANDKELLALMGLANPIKPTKATDLAKAKHIQKRAKPQNLAESVPLIAFFTPDGGAESRNSSVYNATFVFDVYTKDDVELAQSISDRIFTIFDSEIPDFGDLCSFETEYVSAHESGTDLPNTYCFTTILTFSIELEK